MPSGLPRRGTIAVDIVEDDGDWSGVGDVGAIVQAAADAVAASGLVDVGGADASVAVALSSDANVQKLNGSYRRKPRPTNVLSFPAGPGGEDGFLGDVVFAIETLRREADALETPLAHHLQHLTVHGILHLLGFDHQTDDAADAMEAIEIKVLKSIGVSNPYTGALERARKA